LPGRPNQEAVGEAYNDEQNRGLPYGRLLAIDFIIKTTAKLLKMIAKQFC